MSITLNELLKDSAYKLTQFNTDKIQALESSIIVKETCRKTTYYVNCLVRNKEIKLTPEEAIRQLYLISLKDELGYPASHMELEFDVTFGREKKRADICIFDKNCPTVPYILVELKKPKLKDGKEQLKSYCNATGALIDIWSNGESISYYNRKDPNYFEDIPAIPRATENLSDVFSERWTIDDLIKKDKQVNEKKSLKDLILEMEYELLATLAWMSLKNFSNSSLPNCMMKWKAGATGNAILSLKITAIRNRAQNQDSIVIRQSPKQMGRRIY